MAAGKGSTVTVSLIGDSTRLSETFDKAEGKAKGFGSKMGSILGAVGGAAAVAGVVGFGKASAEAFVESEKSAAAMALAYEKFPAINDKTADSFAKLNEQLAKKTKFDDDALTSGQAVLAGFNLTGAQIQKLTPLLADYAAKQGIDIPTAAQQLGKAMEGQGKALKNVGIDFVDAGSTGANFEQVMVGLQSKVGGFAENEGKSASGQAAILSNQFGELQEMVGAKLVPAMTWLADKVLAVVTFLGSLSPGVQTAIGVVVGLAGAALLVVKAVQAWTAVQAALNVVMSANPIGLVVVAIAALVAGVVWAYNNVSWFRDGVQSAFGAIAGAAQWLGRAFSAVWGGIVAGFKWVVDSIKAYVNFLVGIINGLLGGFNKATSTLNKIPGVNIKPIGPLPTFHSGGVVPGPIGREVPIMAQAGETVLPIGAGRGGGGTVINVTVQTGQTLSTDRDVSDAIAKALSQMFARGGALTDGRGGTLRPA